MKPNRTHERMCRMLRLFAWTSVAIGMLLCLFFGNPFRDTNTWLMIGIGFLVASPVLFLVEAVFRITEDYGSKNDKNSPNS
ncbi:hypothetical protein [Paenibacillus beijingensis]|uniref:hypothetical protein n=1 Tax=Paenibacillus beijingensis TaxID=1126833 RepID=UPI0006969F8E|nr:hypothetical protein [Paenibacillus beijingensis]